MTSALLAGAAYVVFYASLAAGLTLAASLYLIVRDNRRPW